MVKGEQLNSLLAGYFERGKQTLEMQLPDGPSADRHAWAAAAGEHGREVHRDDDNDGDAQRQRLARLELLAQREMAQGWQPPVVNFHNFLNCVGWCKSLQAACANPVISRVELICLVLRCRLLSCVLVVLGREAWKAQTCGIRFWTMHSENLLAAGNRRELASCSPKTTEKPKRGAVVHLVTL